MNLHLIAFVYLMSNVFCSFLIFALCIAHFCTSLFTQDLVMFMSFFQTLRPQLAIASRQARTGLQAMAAAAPGLDRLPGALWLVPAWWRSKCATDPAESDSESDNESLSDSPAGQG